METTEVPEPIPSRKILETEYEDTACEYERILVDILSQVKSSLEHAGLSLTYKYRVKTFSSYFSKKVKFYRQSKISGKKSLPITDLLGIRIICPFIGDLPVVEQILGESFTIIEVERKGSGRSFKEFGYESTHILVEIPKKLRVYIPNIDKPVVEVQVRSILQDAWAEVEHELVYKAEFTPHDEPMKRKLAALNANLTLSDMLFQELRDYQHKLSHELDKRRVAFFNKIEDAIDSDFYVEPTAPKRGNEHRNGVSPLWIGPYKSIDDLLLDALNAHNKSDYLHAIDIYSHILAMNPGDDIRALIHKHRGMAYFAESRYKEANEDFSIALTLDKRCYKAAYYRGVVQSVLQNYSAAIEDFNHALELHPYHFYALYRRSQAYYHLGDYPKSLSDCDTALELQPDNDMLQRLRGMGLKKLAM